MKVNTNKFTLKSFSRRSQRKICLEKKLQRLIVGKDIRSLVNSHTSQNSHELSQRSLNTNDRVQDILGYRDSIQSLFSGFDSRVVSLNATNENINYAQQNTGPLDSKHSNGDDDDIDTDWLSVSSEEEDQNDDVLDGSNDKKSDGNIPGGRKYQGSTSSSSRASLNSDTNPGEGQDEKLGSDNGRTHSSLEIAILLALFRHRYSLSKACTTDICHLLRLLGVQNVSADYRSIYKLINPLGNSMFLPKLTIVCPTCCRISTNSAKCPHVDCISHACYTRAPTVNYTFNLSKQIKSILERVPLMYTKSYGCALADVVDGLAHSRIRNSEKGPFVTITLNSDGVLVKHISRSLWITTMIINELPRSLRFQLPNMIIGMISYGSQKPKRAEFRPLLNNLVDELVKLEHGIDVHLPSADNLDSSPHCFTTRVAVYLLGVVADKPAQSIIQNTVDSGGFYGCTNCHIAGESVAAGRGFIRCFPTNHTNLPELRSNKTYDEAMKILRKSSKQRVGRNSLTGTHTDEAKGYVGPCALRRLRFFDMGHSFLTDSLHNLYGGLFLRLLKIWLEPPSLRRNTTNTMSIFDRRIKVEKAFDSIHFPTSTYRIPRHLRHFGQFKANELRLCLLMGYNCFRSALSSTQYKHLQALAFALHLAEARSINDEMVTSIDILLKHFIQLFRRLYTKRHIVSVVHSVVHVSASVREYGPLMNYSTFNFESLIGTLVRTIHDPSQPSNEICYNLELLHRSWLYLDNKSFSYSFKLFINQINASSRQARAHHINRRSHFNIRFHHRIRSLLFVEKYLPKQEYELYRTIFYKGLRYSYKKLPNSSRAHDGCLLYCDSFNVKKLRVGFFRCAAKLCDIEQNNVILFVEQIKLTSIADIVSIDDVEYKCMNVLEGYSHQPCQFTMIQPEQIKEKLAFRSRDTSKPNEYYFYRYPNFSEST
ncbi:unnamed protein product [Adineta ricciae]|uniref:Transposase domain-containing protein n=1 Tax=Adineta ricciae TaxID=249248 RepID=A0A814CQB9_ADIRI|nr:unnamed protein product [Adineta ricciae]CAF1424329.1 unnamed protein product [Adineta ricciae]